MIDQDDLLLLHHLRAHASGGVAVHLSRYALAEEPGCAAGRVLAWSLGRLAQLLDERARRPWARGEGPLPTVQECHLLRLIRCLTARDQEGARAAALWLVPEGAVAACLERAAPLTAFYPARRGMRRTARA